MSAQLPAGRSEEQVRTLFYPDKSSGRVNEFSRRDPNFLLALEDRSYWDVYEYIIQHPETRFPDVHRMAGLSKVDGKILSRVMEHVVDWLGVDEWAEKSVKGNIKGPNKRDNNKPPLRNELIPALGHFNQKLVRQAKRRVDALLLDDSPGYSPASMASIVMQQEILEFVYGRLAAFRSSSMTADLAERLAGSNEEPYRGRFFKPEWAGVLGIVREYVETELRPKWVTSKQDDQPEDGREEPDALDTGLASAVLQFASSKIKDLNHAALQREVCDRTFEEKLGVWLLGQYGQRSQEDEENGSTERSLHQVATRSAGAAAMERGSMLVHQLCSDDGNDEEYGGDDDAADADVNVGEDDDGQLPAVAAQSLPSADELARDRDAALVLTQAQDHARQQQKVDRRQALASSRTETTPPSLSSSQTVPPSGQEAAKQLPRSSWSKAPLTPRTPSTQKLMSVRSLLQAGSSSQITQPSQGSWRGGNKATR